MDGRVTGLEGYALGNKRMPKMIEKPKIMLIDLPATVERRLSGLRHNVTSGTFGKAFQGKPGQFVGFNHSLPLLHEQDIVIIDVEDPGLDKRVEAPPLPDALSPDTHLCVIPERQSYFNPRPLIAQTYREAFHSLTSRGSIIVAFAGSEHIEHYYFRTWGRGGYAQEGDASNYDWSPADIYAVSRQGTEVIFNDSDVFGHLARSLGQAVSYSALFPRLGAEDYVIARSSLGEPVGFARKIESGLLVILPRFEDYGSVLEMMLAETLVDLAPQLFPNSTRHTWLSRPEYQWPEVLELHARRRELVKEYESKIAEVDQQTATEEGRLSFLHGVLSGTGSDLVDDLARTLRFVGFGDVRVMDPGRRTKEEDIQIWDSGRPFLIEAKGLSGCPAEADCQQILKYVVRRQREYSRTDIGGVFVVNHQRHVPGTDRTSAFTQPQIDDAEHNGYALTTTWDLFWAIIATMKGLLDLLDIQAALLSQIGQVDYIPRSWRELGRIKHYYPQPRAALVELYDGETLRVGDMVAFLSDERRYEQQVESLQVEGQPVEQVSSGVEFGIQVKQPVDKGFRFFKVETNG